MDVFLVLLLLFGVTELQAQSSYVCPKKFSAIGRKCYYFSKDESIWNEAYFSCQNLNSSLAIISKPNQETMMRRFLNKRKDGKYERWLGGRFNEKKSKWIWAETGKIINFHGFSRMNPKDKQWAWHCIVVDPKKQNKWSARNCMDEKRYVCQTHVLGKKKQTRSNCQGENCGKYNLGKTAPGFLVKKPTRKSYNLLTFICPPHMILVGRKCYFFSVDKATWSDAHWACRENNTKLAVIKTKLQDNILRGFLKRSFTEQHTRWIGGIYDFKQNLWKWAINGKVIHYTNFAKEAAVERKNNIYNCIILDPQFNHFWNVKNRAEEHHYICQAKSKSVVKMDQPLSSQENTNKTDKSKLVTVPSYYNEVTEKNIFN